MVILKMFMTYVNKSTMDSKVLQVLSQHQNSLLKCFFTIKDTKEELVKGCALAVFSLGRDTYYSSVYIWLSKASHIVMLKLKSMGAIYHLILPVIDWKWVLMNVNCCNICHKVSKITTTTTKIEGRQSLPEKKKKQM